MDHLPKSLAKRLFSPPLITSLSIPVIKLSAGLTRLHVAVTGWGLLCVEYEEMGMPSRRRWQRLSLSREGYFIDVRLPGELKVTALNAFGADRRLVSLQTDMPGTLPVTAPLLKVLPVPPASESVSVALPTISRLWLPTMPCIAVPAVNLPDAPDKIKFMES